MTTIPAWLKYEETIFSLAQGEIDWLADTTHDGFWHPEGNEYVLAWPVRLEWALWWMPEPRPEPSTPDELAAALRRFPPREASTPCGALADTAATVRETGDPWVPPGPLLEPGTRVRSGRATPDFCDGFHRQQALVGSGPWAGTPVDLQIGRAGRSYLIGRLALMPEDERLVADPAAAIDLLRRLRDVERNHPS